MHFNDDEIIMLSRPNVIKDYKYILTHHWAHADTMQKLHALVDRCLAMRSQNSVAEIYIQVHKILSDLFEEYDRNFDNPFIAST